MITVDNQARTPAPLRKGLFAAFLLVAALAGSVVAQHGTDPGFSDIVAINNDGWDHTWDVGLGQTSPVGITLIWNESIAGLEFVFEVSSADSGSVSIDSVAFVDLLLNPQILPTRSVTISGDGVLPDTVVIAASTSNPAGYLTTIQAIDIRTLFFIYMTGIHAGQVAVQAFDGGVNPAMATKIWAAGDNDWFETIVDDASRVMVLEGGGIEFDDPGLRDTLSLEGLVLYTGLSVPINVRLVNDEEVRHLTGVFDFETVDSGSARIDSVVWKGRLKDHLTCGERRVKTDYSPDETGPMTVVCYTPHLAPYGYPLPIGDEVIFQIWLTALTPGTIRLNTTSVPSSPMLRHTVTTLETVDEASQFQPYFTPTLIRATSDLPPEFTQPTAPIPPTVCGQSLQFEVGAMSTPPGGSVALALQSFTGWDDNEITPAVAPDFNPANGLFSWVPGSLDVGIWRATFIATEVFSGAADSMGVMVSVVSSPEYTVSFNVIENHDNSEYPPRNTSIEHGNFDQDPEQEVVLTPVNSYDWPLTSINVYEYDGYGSFSKVSSEGFGSAAFNRAIKTGFFNSDSELDLVMMIGTQLVVLYGHGDNTFEEAGSPVYVPGGYRWQAVLSNYNDDAYLDYLVLGATALYVCPGTATGFSQVVEVNLGLPVNDQSQVGFNSADFDGDGWDDLAAGSGTGIHIFLNDHSGGYNAGAVYPLDFPPTDIAITNEGADFNGDGFYDLCVTLPLADYYWYSDATRMMIYFGQGDGTFVVSDAVTVQGLVRASMPGDFNGDGNLDIAFVNYHEKYLAMLFGDGTGTFQNQVRLNVPNINPFLMDCLDIDTDGDLDVVVEGQETSPQGPDQWYYLFVNQHDPYGIVQSGFSLSLQDDATVELVAPNGGRLSTIQNSIASGDLYRRNLDNDARLDATLIVGAAQTGRHEIVVKPKPEIAGGGSFSLEYKVAGCKFQIAHDLPAPAQQYVFPLFPDGTSGVTPAQGECVRNEHPVFEWDSAGGPPIDFQSSHPFSDREFDFRVATDPNFEHIVESATITGNRYGLKTTLGVQNPTSYFWQIRPSGQTTWSGIYAFQALPVSDLPKDPVDIDSDGGFDETGGGGGSDPAVPEQQGATGEAPQTGIVPLEFALQQNLPNPFNPTTELPYSLAHEGRVKLEVFNVLGNLVATLVDEYQGAGNYVATWDASQLASGIYLYRLSTDEFSATKKMILLK